MPRPARRPGARAPGADRGGGRAAAVLAQQEGAVELAVGVLDLPERGELADGLAFGRLQKRPPRALAPAAGPGGRALVDVPFVAADLVGRARCEPAGVERVKAD